MTFWLGDHPRMRGEDEGVSLDAASGQMDHPRMRGEDYRLLPRAVRAARITPACAGKTNPPSERKHAREDHPRMRGEDHV